MYWFQQYDTRRKRKPALNLSRHTRQSSLLEDPLLTEDEEEGRYSEASSCPGPDQDSDLQGDGADSFPGLEALVAQPAGTPVRDPSSTGSTSAGSTMQRS